MDSVVLRGVYCWLRKNLVGGKVLSVEPCDRKSVFFTVRHRGIAVIYLVVSWDASFFRLYPTRAKPQKARIQSPFVAILRRHILGAKIASILMKSLERVVTFELVNLDLRANPLEFTLIAELMGKNSNLILIDRASREVIDAGKHVTEAMSRTRPILPGVEYVEPPASQGRNPLAATQDEVRAALEGSHDGRLDKIILAEFAGISPTIAREIVARVEQQSAGHRVAGAAAQAFASLMQAVSEERFDPCVMTEPGPSSIAEAIPVTDGVRLRTSKSLLCAFPLVEREGWEVQRFETMAEAAEVFFAKADEALAFEKMVQRLMQIVRSKLAKAKRRLANVEGEAVDEDEVKRQFERGELLKMNVHDVKKGMVTVAVENVFSEAQDSVTIELDASLSPWANVDALFKKAKKAKRRLAHSERLVSSIKEEIAYFDGLLLQIEGCEGVQCLTQIAEELVRRAGMTQRKYEEVVSGIRSPASREKEQRFRRFVSSDGFEILVGRNNAENDQLTLKTARPYDLFVHAQGIPGSHVIVWRSERSTPVPRRTIEEAAIIAAAHSKARNAQHVPVDYTPRSQVKKPKGAVPGKVIYISFQTIFVDPDQSLLARLSKKER